jgi:spore maturation protein CgeB
MSGVRTLDIVVFGLSITSSWGNGHATTYRALVHALARRGHRVRFFERDVGWYADNRDLARPPYCELQLYSDLEQLDSLLSDEVRADLVVFGSYVPQGALLAEMLLPRVNGLTAFYDIDTPVTAARLERGDCEYLSRDLVPRFDLYLSFAGGPILRRLEERFGARRTRPLYCSVDPLEYYPEAPSCAKTFDLGYLGTYSADRQPKLDEFLVRSALRWPEGHFQVAGAQYPTTVRWPANVRHVEHLPPSRHRRFYGSQRMTLNITRADMTASGYSPSVRLFEAAACGVPIVTDDWIGLHEFFTPDREILVARSTRDVLAYLREFDQAKLEDIAARARARVLTKHTAAHRAQELESYVNEVLCGALPQEDRRREVRLAAGSGVL